MKMSIYMLFKTIITHIIIALWMCLFISPTYACGPYLYEQTNPFSFFRSSLMRNTVELMLSLPSKHPQRAQLTKLIKLAPEDVFGEVSPEQV